MKKSSFISKTLSLLSLLLVAMAVLPGQGAWAAQAEKPEQGCCAEGAHEGRPDDKHEGDSDCCHGFCHACGCCARVVIDRAAVGRLVYERAAFAVGTVACSQKPTDGHLVGIFHPPKA